MLSIEDNEILCRVGAGTPMGELMRQYWIPALPASEFPSPDSPPRRMLSATYSAAQVAVSMETTLSTTNTARPSQRLIQAPSAIKPK